MKFNTVNDDLYFEVNHTASSSTPTFTNPIEIRFIRSGLSDTTIRVNISSNSDNFIISNIGADVINATIDPENWVINNVGSIVKDENYLAIPKENKKQLLNIYPNPSAGDFNVVMDDNTKKSIEIYTAQGKSVFKGSFNKKTNLNLQTEKDGYFIVKISSNDGRQWIKTIVKNESFYYNYEILSTKMENPLKQMEKQMKIIMLLEKN